MEILPFQKRAWIEIDLDAVKNNFQVIKKAVVNSKICCVVKANAYGHGAIELSRIYQNLGADFLAVSNIEEAIQLREEGICLPILVLGYTDPKCTNILSQYDISQCIFSRDYAECIAINAQNKNIKIKIHIKLDTGMGRIGFRCKGKLDHNLKEIISICKYDCFILEGVFTHFSSADEGKIGYQYTMQQFENFKVAIDYLKENNIDFPICHCANSAALFDYSEMHMDMVRAGIVLYGLSPSKMINHTPLICPVLKLKSVISHLKEVKQGDYISYGRTFIAEKNMKIATIPIGYADGLMRSNSNQLFMQIHRKPVRVIGRICMDQCMVDVSEIENIQIGDIVTVYGCESYNHIDHIAELNQTISYEILCNLGERVPRVYIERGNIVAINDKLISLTQ